MNKLQQLREDFSNIKVLYVEDEEGVREETLIFLKRIFTHIISAVNGEEGLDFFKKDSYHLVITDLKMPKMNGRDMLDKIHTLNKDTVTIVMTASDSNIDFTQTACNAYLNKPVMFMDFIEALESLRNKLIQD
ncbi:MAG: response regulator [Campylobacterota bacterium]|nr:response regulator [Campylobacterota bacterium]